MNLFAKSLVISLAVHLSAAALLVSADVVAINFDLAAGLSSISLSLNSGTGGGRKGGAPDEGETTLLNDVEDDGDMRIKRRSGGGGAEHTGESESVAMNGVLSGRAAANSRNYPPAYPYMARRMGIQGRVVLSIEVKTDGRAGSVSVMNSSGNSLLDESALEAARRWIFFEEGEMKLGAPVYLRQEIIFSLGK
jgi:TonB family protein